ncbi:MAG TPA: hypothetical protein PLR71_03885 [Deltaproteobacteria bacterium]|nr:hypothetical protein [Deltaproteobacteria bacterium]HQI80680.1 hypothetical protein [Deltaproteobacteria bacterium]
MQRLVFLGVMLLCLLPAGASAMMLNVEADRMERAGSRIEAYGNVEVTGEDLRVRADYIVYDTETEDLWATGGCILEEGPARVTATSLAYNARRKDLHLESGSFTSLESTISLTGLSITRTGEEYLQARSVRFTPCLGSQPDWSLQVEDLEIPLGGYGTGRDVRFMVREYPLIRIPYLLFPARLYRHTGVLLPEFGHGTDSGYRFGLPLYFAPDRSFDATFTPTWLSDRGVLARAEVRYCVDERHSGIVYGESLRDEKGGDPGESGVVETIPDSRWFLKAQQAGPDVNWDINLASTADYLRDIGTFVNEDPLQGAPDLEDLNLPGDSRQESLVSRAQWTGQRFGISYAVSGRFTQDLTRTDNGLTVQELPALTARLRQREIPYTPLVASAEIGTSRVVSRDWIEAMKDSARLDVAWPVSVYPYFTLKPHVAEYYRDTRFMDDAGEFEKDSYAEHWQERGISLTSALYGPRFHRGWYHQIVPGLSLDYRSRYGGNDEDGDADDDYPVILAADEIGKFSGIQASLANYLRDASGMSLADVSVRGIYSRGEHGWEEIRAEANIRPAPWLKASHRNVWERCEGGGYATSGHESRVAILGGQGHEAWVGGDYLRPGTEMLSAGVRVRLTRAVDLGARIRYDYQKREYTTQVQRIGYTSQCWAIHFERTSEAADEFTRRKTTWSLMVKLLGMGDIFEPAGSGQGEGAP